jgi:hypothetical protein
MLMRRHQLSSRLGAAGLFGLMLSAGGFVTLPGSAGAARAAAPTACSKVSASAVAKVVGFAMPFFQADFQNAHLPATKQSGGVSAVATQCEYGKVPTLVVLYSATYSKPLTLSSVESTAKAGGGEGITSYSGLGVPAILVKIGIAQEIIGFSGKTEFRATGSNLDLSNSKLAALAKLAKNL